MPDTTFPAVDIAAPTETSPKLHRTVADQAIEKYILDSGKFLEAARSHTTIVEQLDNHGFDDEELSIGMAMQAEALRGFRARHGETPRSAPRRWMRWPGGWTRRGMISRITVSSRGRYSRNCPTG